MFANFRDRPRSRPAAKLPVLGASLPVLGATVALALAAIAGCQPGRPQVSGVVTLDGQPLASDSASQIVDVRFSPVAEGAMATGRTNAQGVYELSTGAGRGVVAGEYRVTVVGRRFPKPTAEGARPPAELFTPGRYANPATSDLTYVVKPGANRYDIALTSSP